MISWRTKHQLGYFFLSILVLVLISIYPVYTIIHVEPTCTDGIQNQNETGIDCGGSCALICKEERMPLSVLWAEAFPTGNNVYDLGALVVNSNDDTGNPSLKYTFHIKGAQGNDIAAVDGKTYVNAREQFLVVSHGVKLPEVPSKVELELEPFNWVRAGQQVNTFTLKDKVLKNTASSPELDVTIHNDAFIPITNLDVVAVVSDITGQIRGISSTFIPEIQANSDKGATFTWPVALGAVQTGKACTAPTDALVVMDVSGSMDDQGGTPPEPLASAKNAAVFFVDSLNDNDRVGVITFATDVTRTQDQNLTSDKEVIKGSIGDIEINPETSQFTNLGAAIKEGVDELVKSGRLDVKHTIIVLTDGVPNRPLNPENAADIVYAASYASQQAQYARSNNVSVYVIGFGDKVNADYLSKNIASDPAYYFAARSASELKDTYAEVSKVVCSEEALLSEIYIRLNGFSYI